MNNIFDLERFGKYFVYDLKTARSNYGLTMLIVAGMPVILYVLSIIFSTIFTQHMQAPSLALRITFLAIASVILIMSFPAQAYGRITDKKSGSEWVLIPASKLEKFLSMVIITGIIVPLVFLALYFLTDAILSLMDPTYTKALVAVNINEFINDLGMQGIYFAGRGFWVMFLSLSSSLFTFLLGAVFFRRKKVAKTVLVLIGLSIISSIISSMISASLARSGFDFVDYIRRFLTSPNFDLKMNAIFAADYLCTFGVLLAGIWLRIKTIKH